MAVRRLAEKQPASFAFSKENMEWAKRELKKYPEGRQASGVIPLLWKAQEQEGWVTEPAIRAIADMLGMAYIRVLEVATFYTMFNLEPVGKYLVQLCGTTPCMLRGAEEIKKVCQRRIGDQEHVTQGRKIFVARGRVPWRLRQRADGADQLRLLRGSDAGEFREAARWSCGRKRHEARSADRPAVLRARRRADDIKDGGEIDARRQRPHFSKSLRHP